MVDIKLDISNFTFGKKSFLGCTFHGKGREKHWGEAFEEEIDGCIRHSLKHIDKCVNISADFANAERKQLRRKAISAITRRLKV